MNIEDVENTKFVSEFEEKKFILSFINSMRQKSPENRPDCSSILNQMRKWTNHLDDKTKKMFRSKYSEKMYKFETLKLYSIFKIENN